MSSHVRRKPALVALPPVIAAAVTAAALAFLGPPQGATAAVRTPQGTGTPLAAAARVAPVTRYTVKAGDTLSSIARREYGKSADWEGVWWANRHQVADPDLISVGQSLRLPAAGKVARLARRARAAAAPAPAQAAMVSTDTTSAIPAPAAPAPPPPSGGSVDWVAIAQCESGGDWAADTGNGFYGGLQFTESTWLGYGGGQYASSANLASEGDQIAVAERVLAGQGIGAWPVCGARG